MSMSADETKNEYRVKGLVKERHYKFRFRAGHEAGLGRSLLVNAVRKGTTSTQMPNLAVQRA